MLATPASRASILLGRLLSDAFRVFAQSLIILVLAYGLGVFPVTGFIGYVLILFTVAFFGLAWSGISLALGLRTKSAETVFGIAGTLTFPLLFMSTALMDKRLMPEWMKSVSAYNPISFAVNAIRDLIMIGYNWNSFLLSFGVISLIAILTMGATIYEFKKVVS
jgi:ABC-2 type transport system permease protein